MRRRKLSRAVLAAGALSISAAAPAAAQPDVTKKRLDVRAGQRAVVAGATTAGQTVALQVRRRGRWRTLDRDRATTGRFRLRSRVRRTMTAPARLQAGALTRRLGRLNVYRFANA